MTPPPTSTSPASTAGPLRHRPATPGGPSHRAGGRSGDDRGGRCRGRPTAVPRTPPTVPRSRWTPWKKSTPKRPTAATVISIGGAQRCFTGRPWSASTSSTPPTVHHRSAAAATDVAEGNYDIRVSPPRLGDDFDALATAFNQMASRLQAVDSTRQQLFGDLAHEIRTPVAVLEAYIEALEDGVRSLTPQTAAMLRDQTRRLVRFPPMTSPRWRRPRKVRCLCPTPPST